MWQLAIFGVSADMSAHLIPNAPFCFTPLDWSPTGEWLACATGNDRVALFSPDGSLSKSVAMAGVTALAFSRDGKKIYVAGKPHGRSFLRSIDLSTGAATGADYGPGLTIGGGLEFHTRLSRAPDGKSLAAS